jgi:hypothetical protein
VEKWFKNYKSYWNNFINEDPLTEEGVVEILGTDPAGIEAVWLKLIQSF